MPRVDGLERLELAPARVWELLNDPDALGSAIPGCSGFERDAEPATEHRYLTTITVVVGAVKGAYEGWVEYRDVAEPERCTIVVSGRGTQGSIGGEGRIRLAADGEATAVAYEGEFKLTGRVASVGQRLAPAISRRMIVETLRNLERRGLAGSAGSDDGEGET